MSLLQNYPALEDLRTRARRRLPHFVWEYLDSATGREETKAHGRARLDTVKLLPAILHGPQEPDLSVALMGQRYALPFGIAPVGMSGLIWPEAELILARYAVKAGVPYTLSTVACQPPETIGPIAGAMGWFQYYPPKATDIRADLLRRVLDAGFGTLVLTVDVPVASRRERQTRSGLTQPPVITPRILTQILRKPRWALAFSGHSRPSFPTLSPYITEERGRAPTEHIGYLLRAAPDIEYLKWLRDAWPGKLVVKGVLDPSDAQNLGALGVDALWVSNHAGRQFAGGPAPIDQLPKLRAATDLPLIYDSGIEGGLDILRAYAKGADFVMLGRAWHYALGALGREGPAHLHEILRLDLLANMGQLGLVQLKDAITRLV